MERKKRYTCASHSPNSTTQGGGRFAYQPCLSEPECTLHSCKTSPKTPMPARQTTLA